MPRVLGPGRLILATVVVGLLAGLGATGFHFVADRFGESLFAWVESQTALPRVGPESPMVQMGALLGSVVGQRSGLAGLALQTVVRAGIAAAFRSPAGGVLLALELFGA